MVGSLSQQVHQQILLHIQDKRLMLFPGPLSRSIEVPLHALIAVFTVLFDEAMPGLGPKFRRHTMIALFTTTCARRSHSNKAKIVKFYRSR